MKEKEIEIISKYYDGLTEENQKKYIKKIERLYKQNVRQKTKKYMLDNNISFNKCCLCGNDFFIEIHHLDYNNPYLVLPLCIKCHRKQHKKKTYEIKGIDLRSVANGRMD